MGDLECQSQQAMEGRETSGTGANEPEAATAAKPPIEHIHILNDDLYEELCRFICNFKGLTIELELAATEKYPQVDKLAIKSIIQNEIQHRARGNAHIYHQLAEKHFKDLQRRMADSHSTTVLVEFCHERNLSPVAFARNLLYKWFDIDSKQQVAHYIKFPYDIPDIELASNVQQCVLLDSQDGPLVDLRRRFLGEEYEFKLKEKAKACNMHFYDEHDLRRMGYDKTPDIKMIVPFLYKGNIINWIESKATFGDVKTHKMHLQQQLISYCNRFGAGLVIYWLGYHDKILKCPDNDCGVIILHDFPALDDIEFLDLERHSEII